MAAGAFTSTFRIRFSHCDPAGIVYFPRYFDMFNGVVEDWFCDHLGINYANFLLVRRIGLPTVRAECTFARPTRMGEMMSMSPSITRIGNTSIDLKLSGVVDGEDRVEGRLVVVTTGMDSGRPTPIPDDLRSALTSYQVS